MAKKGHSEEQILRALRQAESGTRVTDICREHGISEATQLGSYMRGTSRERPQHWKRSPFWPLCSHTPPRALTSARTRRPHASSTAVNARKPPSVVPIRSLLRPHSVGDDSLLLGARVRCAKVREDAARSSSVRCDTVTKGSVSS